MLSDDLSTTFSLYMLHGENRAGLNYSSVWDLVFSCVVVGLVGLPAACQRCSGGEAVRPGSNGHGIWIL